MRPRRKEARQNLTLLLHLTLYNPLQCSEQQTRRDRSWISKTRKLGERDLVSTWIRGDFHVPDDIGKLFSDISKSDIENDSSSTPLDINNLNRTRPHAIPESDGTLVYTPTHIEASRELADDQYWLESKPSFLNSNNPPPPYSNKHPSTPMPSI